MEDRIAIAAAIAAVFLAAIAWLAVRKIIQRRRFKLRQMGRGKSEGSMPVD